MTALFDLGCLLAAQQVPLFKGPNYKEWLRAYENFGKKFNLDDHTRLREVGFYLGGAAGEWHNYLVFGSWDKWKALASNCWDKRGGDLLDQLNTLRMMDFPDMHEFLTRFRTLASNTILSQSSKFRVKHATPWSHLFNSTVLRS
ncbi:hypothetical protein DSO57_1012844 [Entomophthora muscae]|uniref:Uncharacterized protein n=1 Tax=Entomophthora muscae TaxID=34485 RepID=A0ACC2S7M9_9FUNG|nr:hypothetical protein DSO57_1012844 [Entomophthora muscae]